LYHQYQRQKIQNIAEVDTAKHVFLVLAKKKCPNPCMFLSKNLAVKCDRVTCHISHVGYRDCRQVDKES
jgi:hypothetical protein